MRVLLINPPHPSIGSRIPDEHLPPLGLLSIGGPLIDAGHSVKLLDTEFGPMSAPEIGWHVARFDPEVIMIGHSGSTSGHPSACRVARIARHQSPNARIIYGGVFPTFHWREILLEAPEMDVIVRGEGEVTTVRLLSALACGAPLSTVAGIAFRDRGIPCATPLPAPIDNLDEHRVGWELIDFTSYSYWGNRRAVVVQFSRGCPHCCSYCGQRVFWRRWRHRDPRRFAAELAWLHRTHGVEVVDFADENPTASREAWRALLEALIAEEVSLTLVASTRADDIVRDADLLHLYKQAGVARFLIGMEHTKETTLRRIRKNSAPSTDRKAIQLLRSHGILSMATCVFGFAEETDRDCWQMLGQLLSYDPDQIQTLFATPHRWTPYFLEERSRRVLVEDLSRWDYKHQVLESRLIPPWRLFAWVKLIELVLQARPKSLLRLLAHGDPEIRAAIRWYYKVGQCVWFHEIRKFLACGKSRDAVGPILADFLGEPDPSERVAQVPKGGGVQVENRCVDSAGG